MLGFALFVLGFALFFNCFRCGGLLLESGGCCTSLVFIGFACFSKAAGCIPEPGALGKVCFHSGGVLLERGGP